VLIFGMLVISKQIDFVMGKNLGYNKNNLLSFEMGSNNDRPLTFISELKNLVGVEAASFMNGSILVNYDNNSGYSWNGDKSYEDVVFQAPRVGYGFVETMGMELVAGREFSEEYNDTWERVILNESAVKFMGIENPVGQFLQQANVKKEIIGVVKDFQYGSLHTRVEPLILRFRDHGRNVVVRVTSGSETTALVNIKSLYNEFQPGYPFEYAFVDIEYQNLYNSETQVASLSNYFALLAVLISCLGLFGLATFTAERRAKEIGIRKVLGSSVFGIVKMLSTDFTKMVLTAIIIGLPIAYWASTQWLQNFAYTIDLEWWFFFAAGLSALLVAWLVVGWQTMKVARVNPVEYLKDE
jgi:ABC-type antimicrobial peptide transport system permease subunit